jgi:hypothetical protein
VVLKATANVLAFMYTDVVTLTVAGVSCRIAYELVSFVLGLSKLTTTARAKFKELN